MKKTIIVCDLCGEEPNDLIYHCLICKKEVCEDCINFYLEELFQKEFPLCNNCIRKAQTFKKSDLKIVKNNLYNPILQLLTKMVMLDDLNSDKKK